MRDKTGSGDEEEFVEAAESYLRYLHQGADKNELLVKMRDKFKHYENGSMPNAVVILDMLMQEEAVPEGYNAWLLDKFRSGAMPGSGTEGYITTATKPLK